MNKLIQLFLTFFKIGLFTFGGGLSMLPMLKIELVQNKKWITEEELMNYYTIGQCTPGIIAVNTATFVGYKISGKLGAAFATFGIVSPSLIIILIIAAFLKMFLDMHFVQNILAGVKVAVAALILDTVIGLLKRNVKNKLDICLFLIAFILSLTLKISPIYIIFSCIVFTVIFTKYKLKGEKK